MDRHTVIIVTDLRQQYIGQYLCGSVQELDYKDTSQQSQCLEWIRMAEQVILPTPTSKLSNQKEISKILKENLINCKMAFGGKIEKDWIGFFEEAGISYYDLMEDETVTVENAHVTAEAVVAEVLKHGLYSIRDQKIIVTGYGRCGRETANLLHALGAKVTILARSVWDRKSAKSDGHNAVDFSYGPEEAYGTRTIINTVPACVVTENIIAEMHKDAVIIDIASAPGGTDVTAAEKHGIKVIPALGLPGKYTAKSSAKILADAICQQMPRKFGVGEDKSWIFQIII